MVTCASLQTCENSTKVRKNEHTCSFMLCHEHCAHARQAILFLKHGSALAKVEFPPCPRHTSTQNTPSRPNSVAVANLYVWGKSNLEDESFAAFESWISVNSPAALDLIPPQPSTRLPASSSSPSNAIPSASPSAPPSPSKNEVRRHKAARKLSKKSVASERKIEDESDSSDDSSSYSSSSESSSDYSSSGASSSSEDDRRTRRRKSKKKEKKSRKGKRPKLSAKYVKKIRAHMKHYEAKTPTTKKIAKVCKIWLALDAGLRAYGDECHFRSARRLVQEDLQILLQKRAGVAPDYHQRERHLFSKVIDLPKDAFTYGLKKAEKRAASPQGNFRPPSQPSPHAPRTPPSFQPASYQPSTSAANPLHQSRPPPRCQYCSSDEAPVFHYYRDCPVCIARRAGKK